MTKQISTTWS